MNYANAMNYAIEGEVRGQFCLSTRIDLKVALPEWIGGVGYTIVAFDPTEVDIVVFGHNLCSIRSRHQWDAFWSRVEKDPTAKVWVRVEGEKDTVKRVALRTIRSGPTADSLRMTFRMGGVEHQAATPATIRDGIGRELTNVKWFDADTGEVEFVVLDAAGVPKIEGDRVVISRRLMPPPITLESAHVFVRSKPEINISVETPSGAIAPPSVEDYEALLFGIGKVWKELPADPDGPILVPRLPENP